MSTDLPGLGENRMQAMVYGYDQLHRIVQAKSLSEYGPTGYAARTAGAKKYDADYSYDPNGNLLTLQRRDSQTAVQDNLTYEYYAFSNKLKNVNGTEDENYTYDEIGNLISDEEEGITNIEWTPYGKVRKVVKDDNSEILFRYDASGNRIAKITPTDTTVYARDASGNVMAVYKSDTLIEQSIYGSSRLGLVNYASKTGYRSLGGKKYELSNHLGNVLAVVSDNIHLDQDSTWTSLINTTDYYPFGLAMDGRSEQDSAYRYSFGGHEKLDEVSGSGNTIDMGDRWLDVRLGRTPKMDRQANKFAGISPYSYALNNPIIYIDPDGEYPISIHVRSFAPFNSFGPGNLWKGDGSNRSFTTNSASSRISMVTNYETETQVANSKAMGAMSFSKYGARAYSDAYLNNRQRSVTTTGNSWDLHLYGKNEALIPPGSPLGWSPGGRFTPTSDIDIHNRLTVNATDGALSITGQITGDQFPSAEAFVSDDFGTSIMLGTFATSGGRQMGPVKDLAGDRDLPMINVNIKLSVGENGAFQGVYSTDSNGNEIIMSPDAWNKQFESQSTTR